MCLIFNICVSHVRAHVVGYSAAGHGRLQRHIDSRPYVTRHSTTPFSVPFYHPLSHLHSPFEDVIDVREFAKNFASPSPVHFDVSVDHGRDTIDGIT